MQSFIQYNECVLHNVSFLLYTFFLRIFLLLLVYILLLCVFGLCLSKPRGESKQFIHILSFACFFFLLRLFSLRFPSYRWDRYRERTHAKYACVSMVKYSVGGRNAVSVI